MSKGGKLSADVRRVAMDEDRVAPQFTLEELFRDQMAGGWCDAYANAFDWGGDVGSEMVEE